MATINASAPFASGIAPACCVPTITPARNSGRCVALGSAPAAAMVRTRQAQQKFRMRRWYNTPNGPVPRASPLPIRNPPFPKVHPAPEEEAELKRKSWYGGHATYDVLVNPAYAALEIGESLTSPEMAVIGAGLGSVKAAKAVAGPIGRRVLQGLESGISGKFAYDMGTGAAEQGGQAVEAIKEGDLGKALYHGTHAVGSGAMALGAGVHAAQAGAGLARTVRADAREVSRDYQAKAQGLPFGVETTPAMEMGARMRAADPMARYEDRLADVVDGDLLAMQKGETSPYAKGLISREIATRKRLGRWAPEPAGPKTERDVMAQSDVPLNRTERRMRVEPENGPTQADMENVAWDVLDKPWEQATPEEQGSIRELVAERWREQMGPRETKPEASPSAGVSVAERAPGVLRDVGPHGPVYHEFYHDAQSALAHLEKTESGDAIGALHHPEVGDFDLTGDIAAKLRAKHPEVVGDLQGFISGLKKVSDNGYSIQLRNDGGNQRAGVRLDFDGATKRWLVTAFDSEARTPSGRIADVPGTGLSTREGTVAPSGAELNRSIEPAGQDVKPGTEIGATLKTEAADVQRATNETGEAPNDPRGVSGGLTDSSRRSNSERLEAQGGAGRAGEGASATQASEVGGSAPEWVYPPEAPPTLQPGQRWQATNPFNAVERSGVRAEIRPRSYKGVDGFETTVTVDGVPQADYTGWGKTLPEAQRHAQFWVDELAANSQPGLKQEGKPIRPSSPKRNTASDYLNEKINYGGIPTPRGEVIADLKAKGGTQAEIDRFLQGNELAAEIDTPQPAASTKARLGKWEIRGSSGESLGEVGGSRVGDALGVHKDGQDYTLTHIPSGFSMKVGIPRLKDGVALAQRIAASGIDLGFKTLKEAGPERLKALKAALDGREVPGTDPPSQGYGGQGRAALRGGEPQGLRSGEFSPDSKPAGFWRSLVSRVLRKPSLDVYRRGDGPKLLEDADARYRPQTEGGQGVVYVNRPAAELIRQTVGRVTGERLGQFSGYYMNPELARAVVEQIAGHFQAGPGSGVLRTVLDSIVESYHRDGGHVSLVVADHGASARPISSLKRTIREELIHREQARMDSRGDVLLHVDAKAFLAHPDARAAADVLLEPNRGYENSEPVLAAEVSAKIAAGQWESLGLTFDQANSAIDHYFKLIRAEHGDAAVDRILRRAHSEIRTTYEKRRSDVRRSGAVSGHEATGAAKAADAGRPGTADSLGGGVGEGRERGAGRGASEDVPGEGGAGSSRGLAALQHNPLSILEPEPPQKPPARESAGADKVDEPRRLTISPNADESSIKIIEKSGLGQESQMRMVDAVDAYLKQNPERKVMTDEEYRNLAREVNPELIWTLDTKRMTPGNMPPREVLEATRGVLSEVQTELDRVAKELAGPVIDADRPELEAKQARLESDQQHLLDILFPVRSEHGRNLRMWGVMALENLDPVAWIGRARRQAGLPSGVALPGEREAEISRALSENRNADHESSGGNHSHRVCHRAMPRGEARTV